jgi:hypothetical protein
MPLEIRRLIRDVSLANPLWGAPRIHGELLKLGIEIGQTKVGKYMAKERRPPSQGWRTFISNHAEEIAALDWSPTGGGEYCGVGAGVGISGFRADLGLGDDFFGSREDAYSEMVGQKRWDWHMDDFSARLKPGAKRASLLRGISLVGCQSKIWASSESE